MELTDYVQLNLPVQYKNNGCGLYFMDKWFSIDLLSRLDDNRYVNNGPYKYWLQPTLLLWEEWVDKNVFSNKNLCDINTKTNMVLIRIATSMLNNVTSCITEDDKRLLHSLLIEMYTERKRIYMDYHYMITLGIPF